MAYSKRSFIEHTAIYVQDIQWHIRFFAETLGLTIQKVEGAVENPKQVWMVGGLQLISDPNIKNEGRMAHLGIVTECLEDALTEMYSRDGVTQVPGKPKNWVQLPDGLILEMFEQKDNAVAEILAIVPR